MGIVYALLVFGIVVMFHELGHFILAKKNNITVTEFAIGMGPKLFGKEYNGTLYTLRLLPLGGFCAMGEDDKDVFIEGSFNSADIKTRIKVIAAGPIFNFIMAFVFSVIMVFWTGYDNPVVTEVQKGMPAREAGLKAGDKITKIDSRRIYLYREIPLYMMSHAKDQVKITFKRDGKVKETILKPKMDKKSGRLMVGIVRNAPMEKAGVIDGIIYGACEVRYWILSVFDSLKMLAFGEVGADKLSGPVGIVSYMDSSYKATSGYGALAVLALFLNMSILLSANLGVMNLLPLPALDGGRLFFLIIEAIRGKRISPEKEGMVHFAGFVLLMLLMAFVMINDIKKLF